MVTLLFVICGGAAGGPYQRPVLQGDGAVGEDVGVDLRLECRGVDAEGGEGAAAVVVPVPEHPQHDVVRPDAVAAGAHGLVPGIAEEGQHLL